MRKSALLWFGLVVTALVALGLVVLTSASGANGARLCGDSYFFLKRQLIFLVVGVFLAIGVSLFDYHNWRNHPALVWILFFAVLALLLYVFRFDAIKGSQRWVRFGGLRLQPSELAKVTVVIVLAHVLDRAGWQIEKFMRGAFWPFIFTGVLALPVLLEPDFGSVMVIGAVSSLVMIVAGTRIIHMVPFVMLGGGLAIFRIATNANRMARLFDEKKHYQVNQALAAIGNSNIWGAGLNESMQKYLYLPEAHTDFVFAVGAEELGIIFSLSVVLLFCAFFALSVYIARKATDRFGRFLVVGMSFIVFFQAMFNLGVVCKALPTKGMALPFFSYGGTNLIVSFLAVGVILSVGIHSYREGRHKLMRKVLMRN